jgi:hypothetical protein
LRYGSYIVGAAVVGALAFIIHQRTK